MKWCYTAIYSIRGLSLPADDRYKELIADSTTGLHAILTSQPDPFSFEADRSFAVMQELLSGGLASCESERRIGDTLEEIRARRRERFGDGPFLVVTVEGDLPSFSSTYEREYKDFVVCWDVPDKDRLIARHAVAVDSVIASISVTANVSKVMRVGTSVVFVRKDGKPVYTYTIKAGGPIDGYTIKPITPERAAAATSLYRLFVADEAMYRVQYLFRSSLETREEPLRSFTAAWMAMEIFVNKVFSYYEARFFRGTGKEETEACKKYLDRIREVMKDKYRLADKFAAIGLQLTPDTIDNDRETFVKAKKARDRLLHGEELDEATLPVESLRTMVGRYLQLHAECKSS